MKTFGQQPDTPLNIFIIYSLYTLKCDANALALFLNNAMNKFSIDYKNYLIVMASTLFIK